MNRKEMINEIANKIDELVEKLDNNQLKRLDSSIDRLYTMINSCINSDSKYFIKSVIDILSPACAEETFIDLIKSNNNITDDCMSVIVDNIYDDYMLMDPEENFKLLVSANLEYTSESLYYDLRDNKISKDRFKKYIDMNLSKDQLSHVVEYLEYNLSDKAINYALETMPKISSDHYVRVIEMLQFEDINENVFCMLLDPSLWEIYDSVCEFVEDCKPDEAIIKLMMDCDKNKLFYLIDDLIDAQSQDEMEKILRGDVVINWEE